MARPDFLSQLPSLDELLEHPRVAETLDRINRSSAATQVRSAISTVRAEVTRRAEGLQSLGAGELLDRLVKQLEFPRGAPTASAVNATGRLFGAGIGRPPLAATAIQAAHAAAEGFATDRGPGASGVAAKLLSCERAWVAGSHVAALATVLESLAGGGVCVVARGDMTEPAPGVRLDALCQRACVRLVEVGAADAATPEDFRAAVVDGNARPEGKTVLLARPAFVAAGIEGLKQLASVASSAGALLVVDCGRARPCGDTPAYGDAYPSVQEALAAGADVAVFDAAGRLGGPVAGVVVGTGPVVERVVASAAAHAQVVEPMVEAALAATLALFQRPGDLRFSHPLHQLLDAPVENLRQRAERIAAQIAACQGVASATAVETASPHRGTAWSIRVEPAGSTAAELGARLAEADPAVLVSGDPSAAVLDLTMVLPSQDRALVSAFG